MAGQWPEMCPIVSGADLHILQMQVVYPVLPALTNATLVGYVSERSFSPVMKSPSLK